MISDERLKELEVEDDLYNYPPTQQELNSMARELLTLRKAQEGWQLVPVEPTEDMMAAGTAVDGGVYCIWKDMLTASPEPE